MENFAKWVGIMVGSFVIVTVGLFMYISLAISSSWEPGSTALKMLILISYTGGIIPIAVSSLIPWSRNRISGTIWITSIVFVGVHALSFIPYLLATREDNPSALEALWIPMPLGVVLFFLTSLTLLTNSLSNTSQANSGGEQADAGKPDNAPS